MRRWFLSCAVEIWVFYLNSNKSCYCGAYEIECLHTIHWRRGGGIVAGKSRLQCNKCFYDCSSWVAEKTKLTKIFFATDYVHIHDAQAGRYTKQRICQKALSLSCQFHVSTRFLPPLMTARRLFFCFFEEFPHNGEKLMKK